MEETDKSSHTSSAQYGAEYAQRQLARKSSWWRRVIKGFYVRRLLTAVRGPTIDVGCGAGQILEKLPPGSAGLEVNPILVRELVAGGLDVSQAAADPERIDLSHVPQRRFETLVLSHVLEHFVDANRVLERLLRDASERSISRLVVVVPGPAGYASDATHRTYIDLEFLQKHSLHEIASYHLMSATYFPGNAAWIGRYFLYHELMLVYERNGRP